MVPIKHTQAQQSAPGRLELLRALLNTWYIDNETRCASDRLPDWSVQTFPGKAIDLSQLAEFRATVREVLQDQCRGAELLNPWIRRGVQVGLSQHIPGEISVVFEAALPSVINELLGAVLDAVQQNTWQRLKVCPDCQWVFFDQSRNQSKVWCRMNPAGTGGRGCGSLAKMRRYREGVSA